MAFRFESFRGQGPCTTIDSTLVAYLEALTLQVTVRRPIAHLLCAYHGKSVARTPVPTVMLAAGPKTVGRAHLLGSGVHSGARLGAQELQQPRGGAVGAHLPHA